MAMYPANTFIQTMLGIIAYMFGLRDKGFDVLRRVLFLNGADCFFVGGGGFIEGGF